MSSGFITETELAEIRKKRQEEWEKVRQPDQPLERPEEPQDNRSLYERLKEQKMKKDMEYEEAHKLKNLIRGLDDDEVEFLEFVDRTKMKVEKQQQIEEKKELEEFRQRVASLQEKSDEKRIQLETSGSKSKAKLGSGSSRLSQKSILTSGIVVRKRKNGEINDSNSTESSSTVVIPSKKHKQEEGQKEESQKQQQELMDEKEKNNDDIELVTKVCNGSISGVSENENCLEKSTEKIQIGSKSLTSMTSPLDKGALKCIGILPGIGRYKESSDSEISTDSEEDAEIPYGLFDLVEKMKFKQKCRNAADDDDD